MKFTKEEAGKKIAAKLSKSVENINAWDRTIKENVETLWSILGENNEIELDDFADKALPLFNTTAGFIRKTNADLAKSYEAQIEELKKKNIVPPAPPTPPTIDEEIKKRLEALEQENNAHKAREAAAEKRKSISGKLQEKGIKDDKWIQSVLGIMQITADTDIDAEVDRCLDLYNSFKSSFKPNATPNTPGGQEDTYVNETIAAAAKIAKGSAL